MPLIDDLLASLQPAHQAALEWFIEREGQVITWPDPLDGVFLLNKAKGIHKPAGWKYALSVRQSLGSPYSDKEIVWDTDGSWTYDYFQEGSDPAKRDTDYTNVALMKNLADGVPVAVVHQIKSKPHPRYKVTGLARVTAWTSERKVQGGLRRVLLTQAKRLEWLAERRYEALGGAGSVAQEGDDDA